MLKHFYNNYNVVFIKLRKKEAVFPQRRIHILANFFKKLVNTNSFLLNCVNNSNYLNFGIFNQWVNNCLGFIKLI